MRIEFGASVCTREGTYIYLKNTVNMYNWDAAVVGDDNS